MSCNCGSQSTFRDPVTGNLACTKCNILLEFENYDAQIGGISGPSGTNINIGYAGTGSVFNYKDRKIFNAKGSIHKYTLVLNIPNSEFEVTSMIDRITHGEFGQGDWFDVLIGACCYVVMRRDNRVLPAAEIAEVISCDVYELGRMISRVVRFLDLNLPEMSIAGLFEREINNSQCLGKLDDDGKERMKKQGIFLVNCAVKWFLTTGRRPLPLVAAVMVFVAELNGVKGVRIGDVAKEVHANVATCKLRYKELLETLVKVAQALPWGKDVNVKNVLKHAPSVIQYMEMKSMEKKHEGEMIEFQNSGFDLDDVVSDCLRTEAAYRDYENCIEGLDQHSDMGGRNDDPKWDLVKADKLKLSHECLSLIYTNFSNEVDRSQLNGQSGNVPRRERNTGSEFDECRDWWNGKSELTKKLLLKEILERDVGYDAMPPSFTAGCLANEERRKRINAAKLRINKIMHPLNTDSGGNGDLCIFEDEIPRKKRKRTQAPEIDWEDFIIETLLLHQVEEEEIEKGNYNRLLDLHVFNSGVM
ncbi:hypothetical protein SLEP1_g7912 [Rubroshorea leprosula]|uniref:BRF2-like C-terminal domain-containing protein n=1 Tax=Rubroshorea leprosula TaxID=152421 RepID=A0AAV5I7X4_9ROSI|nr:hypothetical protein SLEP1_g7912 [Rubroshorea leprosula]